MINIDIHNYEEFVLDFMEDNLSSGLREQFIVFINEHPEIKEEMEGLSFAVIENENVKIKEKQLLKKKRLLNEKESSIFQELCIASIEGDLSLREEELFKEYINSNNSKRKEYQQFELTKVKPDFKHVFKNKKALKKNSKAHITRIYSVISIAASILIIFGIYFYVQTNTEQTVLSKNTVPVVEDPKVQNNEFIEPESKDVIAEVSKNKKVFVSDFNKPKENETVVEDVVNETLIAKIERPTENINALQSKTPLITTHTKVDDYTTYIDVKQTVILDTKPEYLNIKSYLAQTFNKRVLKKEKKKIELFDIAQAGVVGLNKVFGGNMKLERVYNENGELDKTEFTSNLVAISSPVKK